MDSSYRAMMRRKLLEGIYDKMSDEEKRVFFELTMRDADHREIMDALEKVSRQVDDGRHSWVSDFGANVAGNAAWDGAVWILSRLAKMIKL